MAPSQAHKDWATFLRNRLGGVTSVTMYNDDENTTRIPIFTSKTSAGIVAATIGLMDIDQSRRPTAELRTELLLHCRSDDPVICNVLSTIAFYILKDEWRANPGTIFESIVSMYVPETKLPHVFFTAPFDWEQWGDISLDDRVIHPLFAIPVSRAEAELATCSSGQCLESLWKNVGTDVFNWRRASAA